MLSLPVRLVWLTMSYLRKKKLQRREGEKCAGFRLVDHQFSDWFTFDDPVSQIYLLINMISMNDCESFGRGGVSDPSVHFLSQFHLLSGVAEALESIPAASG